LSYKKTAALIPIIVIRLILDTGYFSGHSDALYDNLQVIVE